MEVFRTFSLAALLLTFSTSICFGQAAGAPMDGATYTDPGFGGNFFQPADWESEFEIGINGAEGNAQNFNLRGGGKLTRKTALSTNALGFTYAKASVSGVDTQNFGLFTWDYDRLFSEGSPWSFFTKSQLLYDEFRDFDARIAINSGLGYKWIDNDMTLFRTRMGAGASREIGGPNDEWVPELAFGFDWNQKISERQKFDLTVDYFPNISDFSDYRLVTNFGWEVLLDAATDLSLKVSVLDNYDSTPGTAKANDLNYGILLLWKM